MPDTEGQKKGQGLLVGSRKQVNLGRSWFLGIGINEYQHWTKLNNAVRDVQDVKTVLEEDYDVEPECSTIILNDEATELGIMKELDRLVEKVQPEDKVLIYYSGHGHLKGKRGFWVPQDATKDTSDKYIRNSTIRDYLEDIASMHTFLITDACFSGSIFSEGVSKGADNVLEELEQKPSRWALCSGRHDEEVHDGPPGKNSPFASEILNILKENQKDLLNVGFVVNEVVMRTKAKYNQLPLGSPVAVSGHKWGEYVFRKNIDEEPFWQATLASGKMSDFSNYMQKFPQGEHIEEAERAVEAIEEQEEWLRASKRHRKRAYRTFLTKFPKGYYQKPANILFSEFDQPVELPEIKLPQIDILDLPKLPKWEKNKKKGSVLNRKKKSAKYKPKPGDLEDAPPVGDWEDMLEDIAESAPMPSPSPPPQHPKPSPPKGEKKTNKYEDSYEFCVILDAGHGGVDRSGNYVSPHKMFKHAKGSFHKGTEFYEGVWNRVMLEAIIKKLDEADIHHITLSHEVEDTSLTLRTKMANKYFKNYQKSILISIHSNASTDLKSRGLEIYHAGSASGENLANELWKSMQKNLKGKMPLEKDIAKVVRQGKFYMLKTTMMPAILVEHLFFSNYEDAQLLMQDAIVEAFAKAYLQMIKAYRKAWLEA